MKYIVLSVCKAVVGAEAMEEEYCCETIRITALMLGENRKDISSLDIHVKPAIIWENHLDKLNMSDDTRKRMEYAPALPETFQMLVRWCYAIERGAFPASPENYNRPSSLPEYTACWQAPVSYPIHG